MGRGDLDAVLEFLHPDVVATSRLAAAEGTVYQGRRGVRRMIEEIRSVFPDWAPELVHTRDLGQTVVAELRAVGRGVGSGVTVGETVWQVLDFHNGRVVRLRGYGNEQQALEAAGLSE